jgi:O-antigen/teichoic acid export membrane protein
VAPEIYITTRHFTTSVIRELIRYAGSYQLVNILELLYGMLLPVTVMKYFGAEMAGVYGVVARLVAAALMGLDALVLPLLSGGSLIFASNSVERMRRFVRKAFTTAVAIILVPLAFLAAFGPLLVLGWTGETRTEFPMTIWLCCLSGFFSGTSRIQLILYRASGHAWHDNIRQAFRLGVLAILAIFGGLVGFYGILAVLVGAEFIGVMYMFGSMKSVLHSFSLRELVPHTIKLSAALTVIITVGLAVTVIPCPWAMNQRGVALIKLATALLACLIASWPAVALTTPVSAEERRAVLSMLFSWKKAAIENNEQRLPL